MHMRNGVLVPSDELFLAEFSRSQQLFSSTLRELLGILWCLMATNGRTKPRIVFICDNWQTCRAILRGSKIQAIQNVAERIFFWCLMHNKSCWPIWVPRTHRLIKEADRRSRLRIPHDESSPPALVSYADKLALRLWGRGLSFDQAASHKSVIKPHGRALPFNAVCFQPNAEGIDMFRCLDSWAHNINYVFPPAPMTGRLITFLPSTAARTIVVLPLPVKSAWWSYAVLPGAKGLIHRSQAHGFAVLAFDFSLSDANSGRWTPPPLRVLG